jgi:serine/threonine protein kinase
MPTSDFCDRHRLQQLYDETLPAAVADEVADHIATCTNCQQILESMAGGRDWCREASDRLSQSSMEIFASAAPHEGHNAEKNFRSSPRSYRDLPNAYSHSRDAWDDCDADDCDDEAFVTDFAVDFLEPCDDPSLLGKLGVYNIVEIIGRGGMGIVLKGFQGELHRFVAVKVLAPHLATSGAARRRFAREAQATAAVVNPYVMAIHSVHANSKLPYLVMPFVDCESLQQRLDRVGPLDVKDILRIGMQAALGLAAAHAQGLVHRDVKPANILLEKTVDRVMLTDFGLARAVDDATLTRTGVIAGTPQYMSPEQANGDAIDHRSDLFSLGSVLYAMCTARPPFRAETTFGILRRIRETDARPIREINPEIPDWLERIVAKLLAKNPEDRFGTAPEVAVLLEQCLAHIHQPTTVPLPDQWNEPPKPTATGTKTVQRSPSLQIRWAMGIGLLAVLLASLTPWLPKGRPTNQFQTAAAIGEHLVNELTTDKNESIDQRNGDSLFDWNDSQEDIHQADELLQQLENNLETDSEVESR